jgi:hypothetical protein
MSEPFDYLPNSAWTQNSLAAVAGGVSSGRPLAFQTETPSPYAEPCEMCGRSSALTEATCEDPTCSGVLCCAMCGPVTASGKCQGTSHYY